MISLNLKWRPRRKAQEAQEREIEMTRAAPKKAAKRNPVAKALRALKPKVKPSGKAYRRKAKRN